MPLLIYLEENGDLSPGSANFANTSQSCSATYLLNAPTFDQLRASIVDVLGYTDTRVSDGRIRRYLPLRHPAYQWMYADAANYQGVGGAITAVNPNIGPGSAVIGTFALYPTYHVRTNFSPRPYNTWQDKDISVLDRMYYDKDDNGSAPGTDYKYASEWMRFTTWEQSPTNQYVNAQQGQMVFRASGTGGAVTPNLLNFQDAPRLYLPDSILRVRWHEVPYRYLISSNSYLSKFVGWINQNPFGPYVVGTEFGPYPAGSLLYLGANPLRIYTPPIPDEGLQAYNGGNGFIRSRLCDLELTFLYTARTIGTSTANTPDFSAVNRNWVVAGHNLLPWLTTRRFYYASTYDPANPADQTKWRPAYNSFPFQLLFTDCDAAGSPRLDP